MVQQVHLSVTPDPSVVVVDFVSSSGAAPAASCAYGPTAALGSVAPATCSSFDTIGSVCYASLTGLRSDTAYFYSCSDGDALASSVAIFTNAPSPTSLGRPLTVAVWADFGVDDGFGLDQITHDVGAGAFDLILHAGDWAYNFEVSGSSYRSRTAFASPFRLTDLVPLATALPVPCRAGTAPTGTSS